MPAVLDVHDSISRSKMSNALVTGTIKNLEIQLNNILKMRTNRLVLIFIFIKFDILLYFNKNLLMVKPPIIRAKYRNRLTKPK